MSVHRKAKEAASVLEDLMLKHYKQTKSSLRASRVTEKKLPADPSSRHVKHLEILVPALPGDHEEYVPFGPLTSQKRLSRSPTSKEDGHSTPRKRQRRDRPAKSSTSPAALKTSTSNIESDRSSPLPIIPPDPAIVTPRKRGRKAQGLSPQSPTEFSIDSKPPTLVFQNSDSADALADATLRPFLEPLSNEKIQVGYPQQLPSDFENNTWLKRHRLSKNASSGESTLLESFQNDSKDDLHLTQPLSDFEIEGVADSNTLVAYQHPFANYHKQLDTDEPSSCFTWTSTSASSSNDNSIAKTQYYDQYALAGLRSPTPPLFTPSLIHSPSPPPRIISDLQLQHNHQTYDRLQSLAHPPAASYPINPHFTFTVPHLQPHLPPYAVPEHPVYVYFGHDLSSHIRTQSKDNDGTESPPMPRLINDQLLFMRTRDGDETDHGFGPGVTVHENLRDEVGRAETVMLKFVMMRESPEFCA